MSLFETVVVLVFVLSAVTFIVLFGQLPALRKSPIGFLHRLFVSKIPAALCAVDRAICGGHIQTYLGRTSHYMLNENHPLVFIFFIVLQLGAELVFLPSAWPHMRTRDKLGGTLAILAPYLLTLACLTSRAIITPATHAREMRRYPYDRILYHPGQLCGTCKLLKPARSKHCRICKVCVSRHDHHCVWLMCCVDRGNYVYFMSLLLSLTALTAYGCVVGFDILDEIVQEAYLGGYLGPVEAPRWTSGRDFFSKAELMGVAVGENLRVGSVSLLCFMCCPLPLAMFGYHVYLIWAGITTNETSKWEVWKELVAEKAAFAATKGEVYERILSYERETDWPAKSEQTLRCTRDARPPRVGYHYNDRLWEIVQPADEGAPEDSRWERVKDMTEVVNMYDMGFVANLRDALGMDVSKRP